MISAVDPGLHIALSRFMLNITAREDLRMANCGTKFHEELADDELYSDPFKRKWIRDQSSLLCSRGGTHVELF